MTQTANITYNLMNANSPSLPDEQREPDGVGEDELGAVDAVRAALPEQGARQRLQVDGALAAGHSHAAVGRGTIE